MLSHILIAIAWMGLGIGFMSLILAHMGITLHRQPKASDSTEKPYQPLPLNYVAGWYLKEALPINVKQSEVIESVETTKEVEPMMKRYGAWYEEEEEEGEYQDWD